MSVVDRSGGVTVLGRDIDTGQAVPLTEKARDGGLYVIGKQRMGKTSLLLSMMLADAEAGRGFCFLDPHGDAVYDLIDRLPEERLPDVVLLDVGDSAFPFGVNFFEVPREASDAVIGRRADQTVEVFEKLWGDIGWGARLADLLGNIAHTLIENPPYTLAEVPRLLADRAFRQELTSGLRNPVVREYWDYEYDPMRDQQQRERTESTTNKVRAFLRNPVLRNIVGQSHSTVDMRHLMDEQRIVLVRLAAGDVGDTAVNLLGSMLVGMVANSAFSRVQTSDRSSFYLYADEYQRFATNDFAKLLSEAPKYGVSTITAHQDRSQLKRLGPAVAEIKAVNLVVFRVSGDDAQELSLEFNAERQRDVTGYKPTLEVSARPVDDLLRRPTENERVARIVRERLRPLVEEAEKARGAPAESCWVIHEHGREWYLSPETLSKAISEMNTYLAGVMSGRITSGSEDEITAITTILVLLRAYLGLASELHVWQQTEGGFDAEWAYMVQQASMQHRLEREGPEALAHIYAHERLMPAPKILTKMERLEFSAEDHRILRNFVGAVIEVGWKGGNRRALTDAFLTVRLASLFEGVREDGEWEAQIPVHERVLEEHYGEEWTRVPPEDRAVFLKLQAEAAHARLRFPLNRTVSAFVHRFYLDKPGVKPGQFGTAETWGDYLYWCATMTEWISILLQLSMLLADDPIRVDSNQLEAVYHDRPIADIRQEIANTLTNLPRYHARCKLDSADQPVEHSIRTVPLISAGDDVRLDARLASIRQRNRAAGYCRPRVVVEEEIAARRKRPASPVNEPVQSLEPARPARSGEE